MLQMGLWLQYSEWPPEEKLLRGLVASAVPSSSSTTLAFPRDSGANARTAVEERPLGGCIFGVKPELLSLAMTFASACDFLSAAAPLSPPLPPRLDEVSAAATDPDSDKQPCHFQTGLAV